MVKIISKERLSKHRPPARFAPGVDLATELHVLDRESSNNNTVVEITSDSFGQAFYERQRYEVNAGRDSEPLLYEAVYSTVSDPTLPRNVPVNRLGPAGVIFEEITEGGEVKFASVGESSYSVPIKQYAVGIEYTKNLVIFNEQWSLGVIERQAGIAYNALLNHLHLYPIINYSYAAKNLSAASAEGSTLIEKYLRTLEESMTKAEEDTTDIRQGPYILLVAPGNRFAVERALTVVPQQGTPVQSSAIGAIAAVVVYNGWTGRRGKKSVVYPGVATGVGYLISTSNRTEDFQSFEKQGLNRDSGNADVSRFILEQTVWDFYRGVYSNPAAAVQKITFPTS